MLSIFPCAFYFLFNLFYFIFYLHVLFFYSFTWTSIMYSLEKCLFKASSHFLIGLLFSVFVFFFWYRATWTVYILEINLLSVTSFANIFPVLWTVFYLFMVSFAIQKILNLIRIKLFIFIFIILEIDPKRYCCNLCQGLPRWC